MNFQELVHAVNLQEVYTNQLASFAAWLRLDDDWTIPPPFCTFTQPLPYYGTTVVTVSREPRVVA